MSKYTDPTIPGKADGTIHGDDSSWPNRGTRSGFVAGGLGAPYGADVDMDATNRMGSAHRDPDSMDSGVKRPPTLGGSGGHSPGYRGTKDITDATDSDAVTDETPQNPHIGKRK